MVLAIGVAFNSIAEAQQSAPPQAAPAASAPISAAEARAVAEEFARQLEDEYWSPDLGRRYAAAIREAAARGDYDALGTGAAFAERLTRDAQAVAPDGHLRIEEAAGRGGPPPPQMVRRMVGDNPSAAVPLEAALGQPIEITRWLAPGVAYIRIGEFSPAPEVIAAFDRFLRDHAEATSVIFDVRTVPGGASSSVNAIFPYLFGEEAPLMRFETRASVAEQRGGELPPWRRRLTSDPRVVVEEDFVTPNATGRQLSDAKVFVLTSRGTASAAEHFALALQGSGRATLIGEVTAGAGNFGHPGRPAIGGGRFSTFVPVGRTYEPRSGKGWEGTGVEPDVAVTAADAVAEALVRSGLERGEAQQVASSLPPMRRIMRMGQPGPMPINASGSAPGTGLSGG